MAVIPKFFMEAVVSIGVKNKGKTCWIGTGFFVARKIDANGNAFPFLVSNKHVFAAHEQILIRMKEKETEKLKTMTALLIKDGIKQYYEHLNPNIDIAVLPLNGGAITENNLEFPSFDIYEHALTSQELAAQGVDEGSFIFMLGYPMALVNDTSQLPICRCGCIARMSKEQINETHNILVDIQNFPGNSGSPVVLRPELMSIAGTQAFSKSVLAGIVHSYIPYQEHLVNRQTGNVVEIRSENSGLAYMHPVEYIKEIIEAHIPDSEKGEVK